MGKSHVVLIICFQFCQKSLIFSFIDLLSILGKNFLKENQTDIVRCDGLIRVYFYFSLENLCDICLFFSYNCFVPLIVFQVYLQRLKSGKNS